LRKIPTAALVFAALFPAAGTAQEGSPLLTRPGWEAGAQAAHYATWSPTSQAHRDHAGIVVARNFIQRGGGVFQDRLSRVLRRLKYESPASGTQDRVPDWISEARAGRGLDWVGGAFRFRLPRTGLSLSLQRFQRATAPAARSVPALLQLPLRTGRVDMRIIWGAVVLAPTVEADVLLQGRQVSKLSDTGLGYIDVTK